MMKRNKKGMDSNTLWIIISAVVILITAYLILNLFAEQGYAKPKDVVSNVYNNIEKGISSIGGATKGAPDRDQDGVADNMDLCCDCKQIGLKVGGYDVATSGASIGCAKNQIQTGANNCVNCPSNVA